MTAVFGHHNLNKLYLYLFTDRNITLNKDSNSILHKKMILTSLSSVVCRESVEKIYFQFLIIIAILLLQNLFMIFHLIQKRLNQKTNYLMYINSKWINVFCSSNISWSQKVNEICLIRWVYRTLNQDIIYCNLASHLSM